MAWSALDDGDADDGDAEFVGQVEEFLSIDHDDVAGGECEAPAPVLVEVSDGGESDGWDVAAPVVPGASALAEGPALGLAEFTDTLDHAVGAFDGFDGDDVAFADGDGLSDVEAEGFAEERPDEVDVGGLCGGWLAFGHDAGGGEFARDGERGVEQLHAAAVQFLGDGGEDGMGASVVAEVAVPGDAGAQVGQVSEEPERVVHEFGLIDPSDHDGVVDAPAGEDPGPCADAEDADVLEGVAELWEFGLVLA